MGLSSPKYKGSSCSRTLPIGAGDLVHMSDGGLLRGVNRPTSQDTSKWRAQDCNLDLRAPGPLPPREGPTSLQGTSGPRLQPGIWVFPASTEVTGPRTPVWGQGSGKMAQAALPQASLLLGKASIAAAPLTFLKAGANPVSPSVRAAPTTPHPPNRAAPASEPLLGAQPPPIPQREAGLASFFHMHLTPTKGSSQTTGHTKETSQAKHQKTGLPPPCFLELSGDIKWQLPTLNLLQSILQLVFFSLCFIFSAQMEKCIRQTSAHLDPLAPHRDVAQLPASPSPFLRETP